MADICPFVLRVTKDPETGLCEMERIDVPEAFSLHVGVETPQNALPLCLGRLTSTTEF